MLDRVQGDEAAGHDPPGAEEAAVGAKVPGQPLLPESRTHPGVVDVQPERGAVRLLETIQADVGEDLRVHGLSRPGGVQGGGGAGDGIHGAEYTRGMLLVPVALADDTWFEGNGRLSYADVRTHTPVVGRTGRLLVAADRAPTGPDVLAAQKLPGGL